MITFVIIDNTIGALVCRVAVFWIKEGAFTMNQISDTNLKTEENLHMTI